MPLVAGIRYLAGTRMAGRGGAFISRPLKKRTKKGGKNDKREEPGRKHLRRHPSQRDGKQWEHVREKEERRRGKDGGGRRGSKRREEWR